MRGARAWCSGLLMMLVRNCEFSGTAFFGLASLLCTVSSRLLMTAMLDKAFLQFCSTNAHAYFLWCWASVPSLLLFAPSDGYGRRFVRSSVWMFDSFVFLSFAGASFTLSIYSLHFGYNLACPVLSQILFSSFSAAAGYLFGLMATTCLVCLVVFPFEFDIFSQFGKFFFFLTNLYDSTIVWGRAALVL